ncbi:GGDEF domain-containing protein [Oxalobacteraceae bacterium CAVE-383]|nr:GGDEF domain-containing protein [Oxalobacteraceae bacterium CAVE-383]
MNGLHHAFALPDVCDALDLGLMMVGQNLEIVFWNRWLINRTRIDRADAIGRKLDTVFDEPVAPALVAGVRQALNYGLPVLLSNALHRAPLPIYRGHELETPNRIDQSIVISPILNEASRRCCMIQILDASRSIKRENILRAYSTKLRYEAITDSLTGIANRRSFDEHGEIMLAAAKKRKTPISVFMIDVDFFKQYNDHYGHSAGDATLKIVADALNSQVLRSTDLVARYGGEEFVVLMMGLDREQSANIAERMRATVLQCGLPHAHSRAAEHVTISIGACCVVPDGDTGVKHLMKCADDALYQAKRDGRNRIVFGEQ